MSDKKKTSLRVFQKLMSLTDSKNFSDLAVVNDEGLLEFDIGDGGRQADDMFSTLEADFLLLQVLTQLDDRQKVVFLYQLLRQAGYNLNHEDCARTLALTREKYMDSIRRVKERSQKVLKQTQHITNGHA